MRCRRSPPKRIFGKGTLDKAGKKGKRRKGYTFRRNKRGLKGHSWRFHGQERICIRCGYKPSTDKRIPYSELQKILEQIENFNNE